jgi:hypothetical protein
MKSLPLISHRLFVAALGNESRVHERPGWLEKPSAEVPEHVAMMALAAADKAATVQGGFRPSQAASPQPRL